MNGPARIVDLLKIMSRLMQLLQREIALLRDMKPTEMQDLQRDKIVSRRPIGPRGGESGAARGPVRRRPAFPRPASAE